ncbi:MAG: ATP-binding protein [Clostridia bacterium]|nr:ATP-binding protein [Clostridia bacterium]
MQVLSYNLEAYIPFEEDSIEKVLTFSEEIINSVTSDESARFKLKSAVHELVVNSLEHGYNKSPGKISLSIKKENNTIYFDICDEGSGLDMSLDSLSKKTFELDQMPDISSLTGRGRGLLITSQLFDSMEISPNLPKGTKISLTIVV